MACPLLGSKGLPQVRGIDRIRFGLENRNLFASSLRNDLLRRRR
jgi:hypothetical protein